MKNQKKYYTIYDTKTDAILASGFLTECAKQFGTNKRCMSSIISKSIHGDRTKYSVVVENIQDEDMEEFDWEISKHIRIKNG